MAREPTPEPSGRAGRPARSKREKMRLAGAFALGALAILFGVLNLDEVEVNWIVATSDTPLIAVIAVCLVIGSAIGWVARGRR